MDKAVAKRAARAASPATSPISGSASAYLMRKAKETASMYNFSEVAALQNAAAGYLDTPLQREVQGVLDSLAQRTALGLHESSIQRELKRMTESSATGSLLKALEEHNRYLAELKKLG
ncbi:MAG: hypothetical protein E5V18_14695 [Mesorhizobium sp.]|nr:MAG: hypothetical protein E5V18_14695 [Mesorhizobium sp.]